MKIARFFPAFAACFLSASILTPALAQNAIASISKSALELYDAPDLTASKQTIAVPSALGQDWQVLQTEKRFYQIRAGNHGTGWALRSQITVARESNFVEPCRIAGAERSAIIGGTAGLGKGC
jgi:hypothetical protein